LQKTEVCKNNFSTFIEARDFDYYNPAFPLLLYYFNKSFNKEKSCPVHNFSANLFSQDLFFDDLQQFIF
jgi:hypothetical protein